MQTLPPPPRIGCTWAGINLLPIIIYIGWGFCKSVCYTKQLQVSIIIIIMDCQIPWFGRGIVVKNTPPGEGSLQLLSDKSPPYPGRDGGGDLH